MIKDRKIKVQESLIESLKVENQELKEKLENVKAELEFEKTFKNDEYDELKDLIEELSKEKATYENLVQKAILAKKEYKEKTKELNDLKVRYNKELKNLMKDIKNGI